MKMSFLIIVACLAFSSCSNDQNGSGHNGHANGTPSNVPNERLIVPGARIGKTKLGMTPDSVVAILGKPDYSDAAMGKALLIWYGKHRDEHNNRTEVDIMTSYRDTSMRDKAVKQIRITSNYFKTANDVTVYKDLNYIKKYFPNVSKSDYNLDDAKKAIYDDSLNGIAFEIVSVDTQQICTAILVHAPNTPFVINYLAVPSR